MKKIAFSIIFLILCAPAYAEKVFNLELSNMGNSISFSSITLTAGEFPQAASEFDYKAEMIDSSGAKIYSTSFQPPQYGSFIVALPYLNNANKIVLRKSNKELFSIPIAQFERSCGNGICELLESYEDCSADCASGSSDDYCDSVEDRICDPDCIPEADIDCKTGIANKTEAKQNITEPVADVNKPKPAPISQPPPKIPKKSSSNNILIIASSALAGILLLSGIFVLLKKNKEKTKLCMLRDYFAQYLSQGYQPQQLMQELLRQGYSQKEIMDAYNLINRQ